MSYFYVPYARNTHRNFNYYIVQKMQFFGMENIK